MSTAVHGGDVWAAAQACGIGASEILDFSANVNPRGLPPMAAARLRRDAADVLGLTRYPDPHAWELRYEISRVIGVRPECIVVGEGAEALLRAAVQVFRPRRCLAPVPAFSEYARICPELHPFALDPARNFLLDAEAALAKMRTAECDLAIVNNPHNPSGACSGREELMPMVLAGRNLILDEAFIDYVPGGSLVGEAAETPGVVVVRSLTKFYGCPALRVGYAVATPELTHRIRAVLPAWPVSLFALNALAVAVEDEEYRRETLAECGANRECLAQGLNRLGLKVFPASANYLLLQLGREWRRAADVCDELLHGFRILVRNCDSYEGLEHGRYIRVAVRTSEENAHLLNALGGIRGKHSL